MPLEKPTLIQFAYSVMAVDKELRRQNNGKHPDWFVGFEATDEDHTYAGIIVLTNRPIETAPITRTGNCLVHFMECQD